MVLARLGMARQHQVAPVGGRYMEVDHLDGGELLDDGARGEAGRLGPSEVLQSHTLFRRGFLGLFLIDRGSICHIDPSSSES